MSNSPLVTYTNITKNKHSPRNAKIDTITIHCIVGQWTAKQGCDYFATTDRDCSANYVVGKDGSIGLSVPEADRSWCSSSSANDNRAITIEVASDTTHPYAVTDTAYKALIDLCTDICKRNGIKELKWKADKTLIGQTDKQNMTVHRWFANKSCPGDYLYNLHGQIAAEVNKRLNAGSQPSPEPPSSAILYKVQTGAFKQKSNADALQAKLKAAGFDTYMVQLDGYYKVQVGAYSVKSNADAMLAKLKAAGYSDAFITTGSTPAASTNTIKVGSKVKVKPGAKTYTGKSISSFVFNDTWIVLQINGDRVVIDKNVSGKNSICTPVNLADLVLLS